MHMHVSVSSDRHSSPIPSDPRLPLADEPAPECDFCGRPVRETALRRIHRGDDGVEIVTMCPECELGSD